MTDNKTSEHNRLSGRMRRYARVGGNLGGTAVKMAGSRIFSGKDDKSGEARLLKEMLGSLKGPLMKVAQMLATIPEAVPAEYAAELAQLQAQAPAMGWPFVKRRMAAELGRGWQSKFAEFEHEAAAAASLGQVHKAISHDGRPLACKLQYPEMESAVEADLKQLNMVFAVHRRMGAVIDTREVSREIAERLREELDYVREAKHIKLYQKLLTGQPEIRVPGVYDELSTKRLLVMDWLDGRSVLDYKDHSLEDRNNLARMMFKAWWQPFYSHGIIHGDPHLGNYTAFGDEDDHPVGLNLLDFGCVRIFPAKFIGGVADLYQGLMHDNEEQVVHAYESWGFENVDRELVDILNIWARFIYGPLMDDRVRTVAEGVSVPEYGRKQAMKVHAALKQKGTLKIPKEFVFMDRAAVGLGGVFLHLRAEMNFYRLFNETIEDFKLSEVAPRQNELLISTGL